MPFPLSQKTRHWHALVETKRFNGHTISIVLNVLVCFRKRRRKTAAMADIIFDSCPSRWSWQGCTGEKGEEEKRDWKTEEDVLNQKV